MRITEPGIRALAVVGTVVFGVLGAVCGVFAFLSGVLAGGETSSSPPYSGWSSGAEFVLMAAVVLWAAAGVCWRFALRQAPWRCPDCRRRFYSRQRRALHRHHRHAWRPTPEHYFSPESIADRRRIRTRVANARVLVGETVTRTRVVVTVWVVMSLVTGLLAASYVFPLSDDDFASARTWNSTACYYAAFGLGVLAFLVHTAAEHQGRCKAAVIVILGLVAPGPIAVAVGHRALAAEHRTQQTMLATFDRFATEIEGEYDGTARRIRYRAGALGEACGYEATRLGSDAPWLCLQMDTREAVRPIVEGGYWVDSQPNGEPDVLPVGCFGRAQREGDCDY